MDHIKILKRAFSISWNYKVLWVFGILLALTTFRSGGNGGDGGGSHGSSGGSGSIPHINQFSLPSVSTEITNTLIVVGIGLLCLVLLLVALAVIVHYVSENTLIRLVDNYETTGEKVGVRQGFRLGWSRTALRLFAIDLLIGVSVLVVVVLGLLISAAPLLVWLTGIVPLEVFGTVLSIGLALVVIFIAILVAIALSLLLKFYHRACVLENLGVIDSIRRGTLLVRRRLGDVVIMGLILFALGLAVLILLIPVGILVFLAALVIGGLPALLVGALTALFTQGNLPWILAAIVGVPIFMLVFIAPLAFLGGLVQTYTSTTWTLTFREAVALEAARKEKEMVSNQPEEISPAEESDKPEEGDKPEESGPAENS